MLGPVAGNSWSLFRKSVRFVTDQRSVWHEIGQNGADWFNSHWNFFNVIDKDYWSLGIAWFELKSDRSTEQTTELDEGSAADPGSRRSSDDMALAGRDELVSVESPGLVGPSTAVVQVVRLPDRECRVNRSRQTPLSLHSLIRPGLRRDDAPESRHAAFPLLREGELFIKGQIKLQYIYPRLSENPQIPPSDIRVNKTLNRTG